MEQIFLRSSRASAQILPEIGGILTELIFDNESVIACPVHANDFKKGYPSAFLFPFPSRIEDGKYTFEGQQYQLPINEIARGHAIHGFVAHRKFDVKDVTKNSLSLVYNYTGDYEGYPFPFAFEVSYKLIKSSLSITYKATNQGVTNMPCAFGWHPYFRLGDTIDKLFINIPATKVISLNDKMIATGKSAMIPARTNTLKETVLDNGFQLENAGKMCQTELISADKKLVISQETGKRKLNYLVIYTPPNRASVAIEPLTSNINAFNNGDGLLILKPQQSVSGKIKISLENA